MRYHYMITNSLGEVFYDSRDNKEFKGFTGEKLARESFSLRIDYLELDPEYHKGSLIPTPETDLERIAMKDDESVHSAMETIE